MPVVERGGVVWSDSRGELWVVGLSTVVPEAAQVVQTGTAEDIVMNPADQYVADFVAGISRIHLVKAASVMMPVSDYTASPVADLARTGLDADIDALIHLVLASPHQAVAVAEGDTLAGAKVTKIDVATGRVTVRWGNNNSCQFKLTDPDGEVAGIYKSVARQVAIKIAAKAKDFSAKFPTITVSKNT